MLILPAKILLAQNEDQYQRQINSIAKKITVITKNLNKDKAQLKSERDELLKQERKIAQLNQEMMSLEKKINDNENKVEELSHQEEQLKQQNKGERAALQSLIRQRYIQGQNHYLKILLDQKNPYAVGRLNNYYTYFHQAQQQKLKVLRTQANELMALREEIKLQQSALQQNMQIMDDKRLALRQSQKNREQSVAKLSAKVAEGTKDLSRLKADRLRLSSLLSQLAAQAKKLKEIEQRRKLEEAQKPQEVRRTETKTAVLKGGFLKQKGRLNPPVQGSLKYQYGSRLIESGMRAEGVFFNTGRPRTVHSIFSGRVLFADFLKGYGLLIIIDHGDEHISLYGHNELLYKKVGDMVETDEVISKSGVTGGLKQPGLYFEIRKNATPVNPANWCQI